MCPGEWAQKDISQTGGEAECTGGRKRTQQVGARGERSRKRNAEEEKGDGEKGEDRLARGEKKKESGAGSAFSWVLLCFPLCKPWSPAACQQAK